MPSMLVIGNRCKRYRKQVLKTELRQVAADTGYSKENISAFEHGRNDNSLIMLWYLCHGLTISQIMGDDLIE